MPLLVDDEIIKLNKQQLYPTDVFERYPDLHQKSIAFVNNQIEKPADFESKGSTRYLYVYQEEFATISYKCNKNNFEFVVSDSATTCHIVILIERSSKAISLGHYDGTDTEGGMSRMLNELTDVAKYSTDNTENVCFEMYVFGGFIDERGYSRGLFSEILSASQSMKANIHLQLACVYDVNDKLIDTMHWPIIYGMAVNIQTLEMCAVDECRREPDITLRAVRLMHGLSGARMISLYNHKTSKIVIEPFAFRRPSYGKELLNLSDDKLKELCSTSPHCEPSDFVKSMRKELLFAMAYHENPISEIFKMKPRVYHMSEHGDWVLENSEQPLL